MVYWIQCLTNLLFFDIPLLYCYTKLNSSIICFLSFGYIYIYIYFFLTLTLIHKSFCGTNHNSSIICCLSSGDMYIFLSVALSTSTSVLSFGNYFADFFETLVILSAVLLPIKSPVASAFF